MVYYFTSKAVEPSAFIYVGKDKFENEELIKYGWEEDVWFVFPFCYFHERSDTDFFPGYAYSYLLPFRLISHSLTLPLTHSLTLSHDPSHSPPKPSVHPLTHIAAQFHADKLSSAHIYLRLPDPNDASASPMAWDAIPEPLLTDLAQLTKANSIEGNKKDNVTVIYTPWSNLKKDGSMEVGQVSFKDPRKVKKILVPQRENPIVNRLNKTKVEKKPDLKQERDDRLKELRKRDQAATLERKREEARIALERKEKKWQKEHAYDDIFSEENMENSSNQNRDADWEDDFM